MSELDIYVFVLCLIVFLSLTVLLGSMLIIIVKQELRAIEHGLEDYALRTEYRDGNKKKPFYKSVSGIISLTLVLFVVAFFSVGTTGNDVQLDVAVPRVVMSDSMSEKRPSNTYLEENNLNDQFGTFDLIFTRSLPGEYELELYDIVVYEYEDCLIIHRIIGIEEPNEKHPDHRQFLLRGDANWYSDDFPVTYEQMQSIYRGERIPYVGSFFAFMQSPAGYLCILLVVFAVVATPIVEKKFWTAKVERLKEIGYIEREEPDQELAGVQ